MSEAALLKSKIGTEESIGVPLSNKEIETLMFTPQQSSIITQHNLSGVKSINKYELPFSALAPIIHRRISVPLGSKFVNFMILPYLEYQKALNDGNSRKFFFDVDRTPKNEEMAEMKEHGVPRLVFMLFAAIFDEKALTEEVGIVIAKTREPLTNFNIDYYVGSAAKNFTTHYHLFALKS